MAVDDPFTYGQAMKSPKIENWKRAIKEKLDSIICTKTWTQINLPIGKETIPCKTVFKCKLDKRNAVARYNTRLVAKRYVQKYGIDYNETFALVVPFHELLLLRRGFVAMAWHVHRADNSTAFLNGDIEGWLSVE